MVAYTRPTVTSRLSAIVSACRTVTRRPMVVSAWPAVTIRLMVIVPSRPMVVSARPAVTARPIVTGLPSVIFVRP